MGGYLLTLYHSPSFLNKVPWHHAELKNYISQLPLQEEAANGR